MIIIPAITINSLSAFATTTTSEGVSKAIWLEKFKELAPPAMCKKLTTSTPTKDILSSNSITYDKCVPLITKSMNSCLTRFNSSLPEEFNVEKGQKWGEIVGRCSGADFYLNNVATKVKNS